MCEVRPFRECKPGPLTPRMVALLGAMRASGRPVIWEYSRRRDAYTLDGVPIAGVTLNGLQIRGLVVSERYDRRSIAYRLAPEAR